MYFDGVFFCLFASILKEEGLFLRSNHASVWIKSIERNGYIIYEFIFYTKFQITLSVFNEKFGGAPTQPQMLFIGATNLAHSGYYITTG
jgi:hypothetical protein